MLADYSEAKKFLDAFGPTHTFQTFPDHDDANPFPEVFSGTIEERFEKLQAMNRQGHGIFFTVNETDLEGRRAKNILRVRSLFIDNDDKNDRLYSVEPSIIVATANGTHVYWFIKEEVPLGDFRAYQTSLIEQYGSDVQVKDSSRVLRVPGFFHLKEPTNPRKIEVVKFNPELRHDLCLFKLSPIINKEQLPVEVKAIKNNLKNEGRGCFKNVICGGCPALTRLWKQEHIPHRGRLGLLSIALKSENGNDFIKEKWPTEVTERQIDYAIKSDLSPFTCRTLQEDKICLPSDRITSIGCFPAREGREPSPVRLLGGIKQAFKGGRNE